MKKSDKKKFLEWQRGAGSQEAWQIRDSLPPMDAVLAKEAIARLSSATKKRINRDSGDYEYLVHRGMSQEEYNICVDEGSTYISEISSSWTPEYLVAASFAIRYGRIDFPGRIISVWVDAKSIKTLPGVVVKRHFLDEDELVIAPGTPLIVYQESLDSDFLKDNPDFGK